MVENACCSPGLSDQELLGTKLVESPIPCSLLYNNLSPPNFAVLRVLSKSAAQASCMCGKPRGGRFGVFAVIELPTSDLLDVM
jgi:hypothetical protein